MELLSLCKFDDETCEDTDEPNYEVRVFSDGTKFISFQEGLGSCLTEDDLANLANILGYELVKKEQE